MSELAYNLQGERFQPPAAAASWRVRRLKPGGRGTPDVVFSSDGAPLMLPIETELSDFRRAVGNHPGRYRLDPVTEDHRPCEGGQPAYLQLEAQDESVDTAAELRRNSGAGDDLVRELVRVNADMCRAMADRFAAVMDSTAVVLRAAAGAGLPMRQPVALPEPDDALRNAPPVADDDDEEDDDAGDGFPTLASVLQTTIDRAMPLVNHAVNTKVLGLTTEQSIALMGEARRPPPTPTRPQPRRKSRTRLRLPRLPPNLPRRPLTSWPTCWPSSRTSPPPKRSSRGPRSDRWRPKRWPRGGRSSWR